MELGAVYEETEDPYYYCDPDTGEEYYWDDGQDDHYAEAEADAYSNGDTTGINAIAMDGDWTDEWYDDSSSWYDDSWDEQSGWNEWDDSDYWQNDVQQADWGAQDNSATIAAAVAATAHYMNHNNQSNNATTNQAPRGPLDNSPPGVNAVTRDRTGTPQGAGHVDRAGTSREPGTNNTGTLQGPGQQLPLRNGTYVRRNSLT